MCVFGQSLCYGILGTDWVFIEFRYSGVYMGRSPGTLQAVLGATSCAGVITPAWLLQYCKRITMLTGTVGKVVYCKQFCFVLCLSVSHSRPMGLLNVLGYQSTYIARRRKRQRDWERCNRIRKRIILRSDTHWPSRRVVGILVRTRDGLIPPA